METGCVVCQYIEGKLVDGMLQVIRAGLHTDVQIPDLCLDLRDNCPHTIQFVKSITVPQGIKVSIAKVGCRVWSAISGYATIPTTAGSRYTLMLQNNTNS